MINKIKSKIRKNTEILALGLKEKGYTLKRYGVDVGEGWIKEGPYGGWLPVFRHVWVVVEKEEKNITKKKI